MSKQAPSVGRILAMVAFALSCFALLLFLWLAFGGPIPLKPKGYRVEASFPEAATLPVEADVRMAGVNVGRVKRKRLDKGAARTIVEIEIEEPYAPLPRDVRAILRQKTLLGETYVEITPGSRQRGVIADGGSVPAAQVEPTVELDEIFSAFDPPTRRAFQQWVKELSAVATHDRRAPESLNDALGNLSGFAADGAPLLHVLDQQQTAVRGLVRNTGQVFEAINRHEGALRELIENAGSTFDATAAQDEALAETFAIFPTFLDESRATLARLEEFAHRTRPLVRQLRGPADDLAPTLRDLRRLAPDLERLFGDLGPLIRASEEGVPALERVLRGAEPLLEAAHVFFPQLNPVLSYFNFHQQTVAAFLNFAGPNLAGDWGTGERVQVQVGIIDGRSFEGHRDEPAFWARGNAYMQPNTLQRGVALGGIESFSCSHVTRADGSSGEQVNPDDQVEERNPFAKNEHKSPPCLVSPPSLYDGKLFGAPREARAPKRDAPRWREGTKPAVDPNPDDPRH